jgi:hypothetical protein
MFLNARVDPVQVQRQIAFVELTGSRISVGDRRGNAHLSDATYLAYPQVGGLIGRMERLLQFAANAVYSMDLTTSGAKQRRP